MGSQAVVTQEGQTADEGAVRGLYQQVLDGWNRRDAEAFAAPFAEDGDVIGFDGSQYFGRAETATALRQIFADHQTGAYLGKVRGVRFLGSDVAVLRAVVGMVLPGQTDIAPQANALQTLVAERREGQWRVVLFQNTPAQFHGRPELVQQLTEELRELL
jgi:uncharacterized protein (TIGR02246 family)